MPACVEGDSEEMMERIGQLEDMRVEWQQRRVLEHNVRSAPPELFGVETVHVTLLPVSSHSLLLPSALARGIESLIVAHEVS